MRKFLRGILKRFESLCERLVTPLLFTALFLLIVRLLVCNLLILRILSMIIWLLWGIGSKLPQNIYNYLRRKLRRK